VQESAGSPPAKIPATNAGATHTAREIKFGHVVNLYPVEGRLPVVQQLTASSMVRAAAGSPGVSLHTVLDERDSHLQVEGFRQALPFLGRTVGDVKNFKVRKPFPLLFDILDAGARSVPADAYLIFTNSDICVTPYFYTALAGILGAGFDCLIVNRRTIGSLEQYAGFTELAYLDSGKSHPGFDCFVFPASWMPGFTTSQACVGAGFVMRSLLFNLVAKCSRMLILRDAHLTYHFGDDRPWTDASFKEYLDHNTGQAKAVLDALTTDPFKKKRLAAFCLAHGEIYPDGRPIRL